MVAFLVSAQVERLGVALGLDEAEQIDIKRAGAFQISDAVLPVRRADDVRAANGRAARPHRHCCSFRVTAADPARVVGSLAPFGMIELQRMRLVRPGIALGARFARFDQLAIARAKEDEWRLRDAPSRSSTTCPTTIQWSPPSWTASVRHDIEASAPGISGATGPSSSSTVPSWAAWTGKLARDMFLRARQNIDGEAGRTFRSSPSGPTCRRRKALAADRGDCRERVGRHAVHVTSRST